MDPTPGLEMPSVGDSNQEPYGDPEVEKLPEVADRVTWGRPDEKERAPFREIVIIAHDLGRRINSIFSLRWNNWRSAEDSCGPSTTRLAKRVGRR